MKKPKLAVVIPVHSAWPFPELTIASFLKTHREHYDINLHVGVHANYSHYTTDLRLFDDLAGVAQIHNVEEIDWAAYNQVIYRYSVMHAKNLENLMRHVRHYSFDHLVILDHDIFVLQDFVRQALLERPDADLIACAFNDDLGGHSFTNLHGEKWFSIPKVSAWHLVMSRRLFDLVMADSKIIYPDLLRDASAAPYIEAYKVPEGLPVFMDTFSKIFHKARLEWPVKTGLLPSSWYDPHRVKHFYGSSFNYGERLRGNGLSEHEGKVRAIFQDNFPEGLLPFKACS